MGSRQSTPDHVACARLDPLENQVYEAGDLDTLVDSRTGVGRVSAGKWVLGENGTFMIENRPNSAAGDSAMMREEVPASTMSRGTFRRLLKYPAVSRISLSRGDSSYEFTGTLVAEQLRTQMASLSVYAQLQNLDMDDAQAIEDVATTLTEADVSNTMTVRFGSSLIELSMMDMAQQFLLIPLKIVDPEWLHHNEVFGRRYSRQLVVGRVLLAVVVGEMVTLVDDRAHCATHNYPLSCFEWYDPVPADAAT